METNKPDTAVELGAMKQISDALSDLAPESAVRVLRWAIDIWGQIPTKPKESISTAAMDSKLGSDFTFNSLAELFAKANPKTEADKALVVSYWIQKSTDQVDIDSQSVNKELKHLGHGVANITAAFRNLMARDPQLVIQTRKQGSTQQARKKFRLTTEGLTAVKQMFS